jgi:integrase
MAVIQRKNKTEEARYIVRVRDPFGRWYPSATFDRKSDAERHERELLLKRDKGGVARAKEFREITFAEFWTKWAAECRTRVSEGWRGSQDKTATKYLLPMLGERRLSEIRSVDIGQLVVELEKRGLTPQSILHVYNILHKMFRDAVEYYEVLDMNPVRQRFRPKIRRVEREFLNPVDSWKLLEVARHHPQGVAVWISLLAGLRPGEVQALRWSAVDFDHSQILIRATFNKKTRTLQDHPKQKDWGRAPMPGPLKDFLLELSKGKDPDDFVCLGRFGTMSSYESLVTKMLPKFCRQAGVKRITPHELRHSCTELYVQAGASSEDLRRLLNHKSLSATIRYMHRTDERLMGIANRIEIATPPPRALLKS